MYYIFIENGKINGCGECLQLGDNVDNIEVNENIYNEFLAEPIKYSYKEGKIIKNPNYEADLIKLKNQQRAAEIRRELENLDGKRIRAVCENEIKNTETGETWLDFYNNQIFALRKELISITE